MGVIEDNVKDYLNVKLKNRQDDFTDQVSRIVVTKLLIVCSLILGLVWFHDETTCIPPTGKEESVLPKDFMHNGCWIKGFFVFPHLANHMDKSAYYGIPTDLRMDGYRSSDETSLCSTTSSSRSKYNDNRCIPMTKEFFTQYQWMPFYLFALAFLFHYPYIIFRISNTDMSSLHCNLRNKEIAAGDIVLTYFNRDVNPVYKNRFRVICRYLIKLLYIINHVFAFRLIDWLLYDKFSTYGTDWLSWSQKNSTLKHDFALKNIPSPGNSLLPTFGLCQLEDIRLDATRLTSNSITVICEIESHILYQYTFVFIWVMLVISCTVSCIGLVYLICYHTFLFAYMRYRSKHKDIYRYLTVRECEYIDFIRRKDMILYKGILNSLDESIKDQSTIPLTYQGTEFEKNHHLKERPRMRHMDSIVNSDLINE